MNSAQPSRERKRGAVNLRAAEAGESEKAESEEGARKRK